MVSLKEKWDFSLGGKASAKENALGNNKEIYHLGNRNPAIPLDLMGAGLLLNKVLWRDKNCHPADLHKHGMLFG